MGYKNLENPQKIIKIIDHLISTKYDIKVIIKGESSPFTSKIINADQNYPSLAQGTKPIIIIDRLLPEKGNNLIQSSETVVLKFVISDQQCICSAKYIGISSMPPFFGFILSMPEMIDVEDRRIEKRVVYDIPDFLLAEITLEKGTKEEKGFELDVIDCAAHGLGMIITEKDLDLLKRVKVGDVIKDINFYASRAMLKIDGTVRHLTRIEEGKFKGGYYIGIESKDIIPSYKTPK